MRPASEPSFSPTSCNLRNEWRQPPKLDHLPVLGDGGLTQGTEGAAPTPRLVASHRRLVLPVTEGLLLRCHAQQHHLNDGATLLAFKVHFHHQGANGSHANNGARYTYQLPHEIGLDVLEGHKRLTTPFVAVTIMAAAVRQPIVSSGWSNRAVRKSVRGHASTKSLN